MMNSVSVHNLSYPLTNRRPIGNHRRSKIAVVSEASDVVFVPGDPEITWQIVVRIIVGITPFVVAGIEAKELWISTMAILAKILFWLKSSLS
ncbi:hypothetical protein Tco_1314657 [Tanacetum coccineum]